MCIETCAMMLVHQKKKPHLVLDIQLESVTVQSANQGYNDQHSFANGSILFFF